jgi:hypothetical protein
LPGTGFNPDEPAFSTTFETGLLQKKGKQET